MLQRSIQDRHQLCSLPQQLFHAHRNGWHLFVYIRTWETRWLSCVWWRGVRNDHQPGVNRGTAHWVAGGETGHVRRHFYILDQHKLTASLTNESQIKKPSLSTPTKQIYLQAPLQLEEATRPNLERKVSELVPPGGEVTVTASTLPFSLSLRISYSTWLNVFPILYCTSLILHSMYMIRW